MAAASTPAGRRHRAAVADRPRHAGGRPRADGADAFPVSRGPTLPEGGHDDPPGTGSAGAPCTTTTGAPCTTTTGVLCATTTGATGGAS